LDLTAAEISLGTLALGGERTTWLLGRVLAAALGHRNDNKSK